METAAPPLSQDEAADEHRHPDRQGEQQHQHDRGAAEVLGPAQQGMGLHRQGVGQRLYGGIEQLGHQHQDDRGDQDEDFVGGAAQEECRGHQQDGQDQLLAERRLVFDGCLQPLQRVAQRVENAAQSACALEGEG